MKLYRSFYIFIIGLGLLNNSDFGHNSFVLGAFDVFEAQDMLKTKPQIKTITAFDQSKIQEYETIAFEKVYQDDPQTEYGFETILEKGQNGKRTLTYLLTHWNDEIIDRQIVDTKTQLPRSERIGRGTKIIWRDLKTPDAGDLKYWKKMTVWATKYDHNCLGCNNTTAVGAFLQKGVCAVDPQVIKLWTKFYVEGYGLCQALDVGGAIKGNKIDLAYEDVKQTNWGSGWKEIYIIDNEP